MVSNQDKRGSQGNKSEASQKMRSGTPQERSQAASELGQKGGRSRKQD